MKDIRETTAVQTIDQNSVDSESLLESAVTGDQEMEEHTFLQMSNGSIKEIDPIDETMNLIQKHYSFRPNSFEDKLSR